MGPIILAGLLALVALYLVLRPLARPPVDPSNDASRSEVEDLLREKESVFLAITELDFDHKTGVVSDEDHAQFMARYRERAVALMKALDDARGSASSAAPPEEPAGAQAGEGAKRSCSGCGLDLTREDRFCTRCGRPFPAALAVLLVLACSTLLNPGVARAGEITGRIFNQTKQEAVEGIDVILVQGEMDAPVGETPSDKGGEFRFENVAPGEYTVGARYLGVPYAQRGIRISEEAPRAQADLRVYETTTSDDAVAIRGDHLILQTVPEGIRTTEILVLENTGDRTYLGELSPSSPTGYGYFLPLPRRYSGRIAPEWLEQRIYHPTEDGFHVALPLAPGTTQLTLSYNLPRSIWGTSLDRRFPFRARAVNVAVPLDQDLKVVSKALGERQAVNIERRGFMVSAGGPFDKDAPVEIAISGGLQGLGLSARQVGWGVGSLLTTGLGLIWVVRRGRRLA